MIDFIVEWNNINIVFNYVIEYRFYVINLFSSCSYFNLRWILGLGGGMCSTECHFLVLPEMRFLQVKSLMQSSAMTWNCQNQQYSQTERENIALKLHLTDTSNNQLFDSGFQVPVNRWAQLWIYFKKKKKKRKKTREQERAEREFSSETQELFFSLFV